MKNYTPWILKVKKGKLTIKGVRTDEGVVKTLYRWGVDENLREKLIEAVKYLRPGRLLWNENAESLTHKGEFIKEVNQDKNCDFRIDPRMGLVIYKEDMSLNLPANPSSMYAWVEAQNEAEQERLREMKNSATVIGRMPVSIDLFKEWIDKKNSGEE
jgi:hypothetical protein